MKASTADPRGTQGPTPMTITPPVQQLPQLSSVPVVDPVQSTLLALLNQAANAVAVPNG